MLKSKLQLKFLITCYSLKEAKKKLGKDRDIYVIDITKIVKDLGYDLTSLSQESEFVINFSIRKKISQGIYNTKSDEILVIHKGMNNNFIEGLESYLEEYSDEVEYVIDLLE
jgi:hypothetical protein